MQLTVLSETYGRFPEVLPLNPDIAPDSRLLKTRLEIAWRAGDAVERLRSLEERLELVSPSFRRHGCGGDAPYRLFAARRPLEAVPPAGRPPVEPALALAHLIEHVMIDTVSYVTQAASIAGVTGALFDPPGQYDVFVESPDGEVALLARRLSCEWVEAALVGEDLDAELAASREEARELFRRRSGRARSERRVLGGRGSRDS
jgi:hypothetical protein